MPVSTRSRKRKLSNEASSSSTTPLLTKESSESKKSKKSQVIATTTTSEVQQQQRVICGTSGYSYAHWNGTYYPRGYGSKQWEYYSSEFHAVELNATFYRWHKAETWRRWRDKAAAAAANSGGGNQNNNSFVYAVKAHQYFSHWRRLTVDETFVTKFKDFVKDCRSLGPHCGPVLLQFPPRFECNETTLGRLEQFGQLVKSMNDTIEQEGSDNDNETPFRLKVALEFRHKSWFNEPEVYNVAKEYNLCICLVHLVNKNPSRWADDMPSGFSPKINEYPFDACNWGMYARFHGTTGQYEGAYDDTVLDEFLSRCNGVRQLYVFFNNTDSGDPPSAVRDARHICQMSL